ncbi:hypothetical protein COT48_02095, partial [Candidatus Woesearchaeota archaeon CG08_land_8_20_14_0_20_47_9]
MRILHIIDHLGCGGAQVIVRAICENDPNTYSYALRKDKNNLTVQSAKAFQRDTRSRLDIKSLFELRKIIRDNKIDALHCHLAKSFLMGWLLKALYFKDIKLIFHEHGRIFTNQRLYNKMLNFMQHKVDLFIAVSEATKRKLVNNAGVAEDKIKVLYNFVDLDKFKIPKGFNRQKERAKLGIKKGEFVIGFVGRLAKQKGCEYLIRALPYLKFKFKAVIAGDGLDRKKLEELTQKLQIKENIIFLGYV